MQRLALTLAGVSLAVLLTVAEATAQPPVEGCWACYYEIPCALVNGQWYCYLDETDYWCDEGDEMEGTLNCEYDEEDLEWCESWGDPCIASVTYLPAGLVEGIVETVEVVQCRESLVVGTTREHIAVSSSASTARSRSEGAMPGSRVESG